MVNAGIGKFAADSQEQPNGRRAPLVMPENLRTAIYGGIAAPMLHYADKYGLFAELITRGPAASESTARRLGLDPDTTQRLLIVLSAFGVVVRCDDDAFGVPAQIVPFVDPKDPNYIGGFVTHMVDDARSRLERIEQYLVKGKPLPCEEQGVGYSYVYRDEDSTAAFFQAMWAVSFGVSKELAQLAQLEDCHRLIDVGGANGPFAVSALLLFPALSAVVFDLPQAGSYLNRSRQIFGLQDRLDFVGGDFFQDPLPQGDVIALGYVLSNWPDDRCLSILRRAYDALEPGGRVLVMDRLFDDTLDGPVDTAVMNLLMHVETYGRHRSAAQFRDLLADAGFTGCQVVRSAGDKHLVIGHKGD
jgi:O-methyltransferase